MVTKLAQKTEIAEVKADNTNIEELVKEIGLTFWAEPEAFARKGQMTHAAGIDEELIYEMGYTLGDLPANIQNNAHEYCNSTINKIAHAKGHISFNDLQNEVNIYLAGYQAGLKAR